MSSAIRHFVRIRNFCGTKKGHGRGKLISSFSPSFQIGRMDQFYLFGEVNSESALMRVSSSNTCNAGVFVVSLNRNLRRSCRMENTKKGKWNELKSTKSKRIKIILIVNGSGRDRLVAVAGMKEIGRHFCQFQFKRFLLQAIDFSLHICACTRVHCPVQAECSNSCCSRARHCNGIGCTHAEYTHIHGMQQHAYTLELDVVELVCTLRCPSLFAFLWLELLTRPPQWWTIRFLSGSRCWFFSRAFAAWARANDIETIRARNLYGFVRIRSSDDANR